MEDITLNTLYKHILKIEKKLEKVEHILQIPEETISEEELKEHLATVKRMKEGKEGTDWEEVKKEAGLQWRYLFQTKLRNFSKN